MKKTTKEILFERMKYLNEDFHEKKPSLIIPVGISGSGKSTWISSIMDSNTVVVSPDEIRREITGDISDQSKNDEVFKIAFDRAVDHLNSGKNVIFDATNISSFHRREMLKTFKKRVEGDFDAKYKVFNVDPEVTKERIKKDIESGVDRSNVPPEAVDRQYKTFKKDLKNLTSDGYSEL